MYKITTEQYFMHSYYCTRAWGVSSILTKIIMYNSNNN